MSPTACMCVRARAAHCNYISRKS